jgi:hypothetical protein
MKKDGIQTRNRKMTTKTRRLHTSSSINCLGASSSIRRTSSADHQLHSGHHLLHLHQHLAPSSAIDVQPASVAAYYDHRLGSSSYGNGTPATSLSVQASPSVSNHERSSAGGSGSSSTFGLTAVSNFPGGTAGHQHSAIYDVASAATGYQRSSLSSLAQPQHLHPQHNAVVSPYLAGNTSSSAIHQGDPSYGFASSTITHPDSALTPSGVDMLYNGCHSSTNSAIPYDFIGGTASAAVAAMPYSSGFRSASGNGSGFRGLYGLTSGCVYVPPSPPPAFVSANTASVLLSQ